MDDATSTIYSAFLIEEEGTASTLRALLEVFTAHGLPSSLYTDRGSHYFHTPQADGPVDKDRVTQVGRALKHLGVEHIPAYSPEARGRSERMFATLQDRLIKELAKAGRTAIEAANAWIRDVYLPAHNARFAKPPALADNDSWPPTRRSSPRPCASRRSAWSPATTRSPMTAEGCNCPRARRVPTTSRRGSRCANIPTAPSRCSTARGGSQATPRWGRRSPLSRPPRA